LDIKDTFDKVDSFLETIDLFDLLDKMEYFFEISSF